jgi:hypothetical protein
MDGNAQPLPPILQESITKEIDEWWASKQHLADATNAPTALTTQMWKAYLV